MPGGKRPGDTTYYEIHGFAGNRWTVLDVYEDKAEAAAEAQRRYRSGAYRAVRLLRERYTPASGEYESLEIAFHGRRHKPSKYDGELPAAFCSKAADLYTAQGRREITRLLAPVLEAWQLTSVEILYNFENYIRLDNAGTHILRAVQRMAIAQARETGQPVAERMRHLFRLIDSAVATLKRAGGDGVDELAGARITDVVARLESARDRKFRLSLALAADLRQHEGTRAKMQRLVALLRYDHPSWAHEVLDLFLSEQLQHRRLLRELLPTENLVARLEMTAALTRGEIDGYREAGEDALVLSDFLKINLLPLTRAVLVEHVVHEMETRRRLTDGGLAAEVAALDSLLSALGETLDADIGQTPLSERIEERCARLLNPQSLADYLALGNTPAEKLARLLDLEQHMIGIANRRTLARYMLPLVEEPSHESFWLMPPPGAHRGRMKLLAGLQRRVLASELARPMKERLAGALDRLCHEVLVASDLFQRLARSDATPAKKGEQLLILLGEGCFTAGRARKAAEAEMRRYLADPDFLAPVAQARTAKERREAADRLRHLLAEAGIAAPGTL